MLAMYAVLTELVGLGDDVADKQMRVVYLGSPEPIIVHPQLMGEIIRHVLFLSTDGVAPPPAYTPPKYSPLVHTHTHTHTHTL